MSRSGSNPDPVGHKPRAAPNPPTHKAAWLQQMDRIEAKLDALLKALAEDDEAPNMGLHTGDKPSNLDSM